MAVTIYTLDELYNQILNDIASEFEVDVSELGITYQVEAKVQAAMLYQMYLSLSGVQKNIFYDTAEDSVLIRYGSVILGRTPAPAESGEYQALVSGTAGAIIKAGTQFIANDDTLAAQSLYVVDNDFTLSGVTGLLPIRALTPGTSSALLISDKVTATSPIVNVNSEAEIIGIIKPPKAAESIEEYRADIIAQAEIEPQGGSPGDFRLWATDVTEVRTVYPYATQGSPGNMQIYIEATPDNTAPAEVVGVPTQQTIDAVYKNDGIDPESGAIVINPTTGKGRKPIGVFSISALAVTPIAVDIKFQGLSDESIVPQLRTSLESLMYSVRPFVAGADLLRNKNDILSIGQVITVIITILTGTGITYTNVTMEVNGIQVNEEQFLLGNYPFLRFIYNDGSPV